MSRAPKAYGALETGVYRRNTPWAHRDIHGGLGGFAALGPLGVQLVVFDALGHVPHEEDPAATVAVVQRFLGL